MAQGSADQLQSIPMSPNLSQSFGRARDFAREQNHRALLLEHLLLALTEDPEASGVLRACNVDIVRLSTDISGYLGRLTEDMRAAAGTEPGPDAELLRVIEAARQAAQQSRRKAIDGAIVLAAIVGDAKSPAAGLLKTHGMTFDEAIKTLQKASAQARTKQYSTPTVRLQPDPAAGAGVKEPPRAPAPPPAAERPQDRPIATSAAPQPAPVTQTSSGVGQTVDDILAAARARIQQRNAGPAPKPEPAPEVKPKPAAEPPRPEPERPPGGYSPYSPPIPGPGPELPDPPPLIARPPAGAPGGPLGGPPGGLPGGPPGPLPGLPPTPAGASPAPPLPPGASPVAPEPALPPPRMLQKTAEGGPRPPPPRWPDGAGRGDRLEAGEPTLATRPVKPGGPPGPPRRPSADAGRPQGRQGAPPGRAAGQRAAAGPLMEAIPRRMRIGAPTLAHVRIGRDKIDSLMQLLAAGRTPPPPADAIVARVLSVRLVAPEGGFAIEAESPETQWIESSPGQPQEDHVGWRWAVTPLESGRLPLQLVVAARTLARDGLGPEAAPPDRTIEIAVRPNRLRRLVRGVALILLFAAGVGLGRLSHDRLAQDLMDVAGIVWKGIVGLLVTSGFLAG